MSNENRTENRTEKMKKKKRRKKHYLLRLIIFIAVCVGAYFALHIDYFTVNGIAVVGNKEISDEEIIKLSELETGVNLFDVHPWLVQRKIKKNLYVEDVDVDRKLPNKIEIRVTERSGKAQFAMGKKFVITDNEGMVLEIAKEERQVTLVEGVSVQEAELKKDVKIKENTLYDEVMQLINATEQNDLYFKKIKMDSDSDYVEAYIYDDLVCKGRYDNLMNAVKSDALKAVVYNLYQNDTESGTINIGSNNYCSFTP